MWEYLRRLHEIACSRGRQAYLVGGFLRDFLLGRPSRDADVVVTGRGEEVARELAGTCGGSFVLLDPVRDVSRVVIRGPAGSCQVDVTGLGDGDLVSDLRRRDFTINALALPLAGFPAACPGEGGPPPAGPFPPGGLPTSLIDPLGGLDDLRRGLIRACGPRSIEDDPLRALRAARLAGQLGFRIEPGTVRLIRAMPVPVSKAAPERIWEELVNIFLLPAARAIIDLLDRELGILEQALPEIALLRCPGQEGEGGWERGLKALECLEETVRALSGPGAGAPALVSLPGDPARQLAAYLNAPLTRARSRLPVLKLACLFHAAGGAEGREPGGACPSPCARPVGAALAEALARRLRLAGREEGLLAALLEGYAEPLSLYGPCPPGGRAVYRFFRRLGDEAPGCLLLSLAAAAAGAVVPGEPAGYREFIFTLLRRYYEEPELSGRARPLLDGKEVMRLVRTGPSPLVGRLLEDLAAARAAGEVRNRQEAEEYVKARARALRGERGGGEGSDLPARD
ncbi:CCA tRNA nucleotidyltransferase [Desulfovirgula thermocuniculi]|uniref:CCA tRNA nucleotidyltransferase n=1 Tax=Desulfovirgula thermocuniculi TaxID=348842 RepID=UPI0003FE2689|nr:CCA tRNA nucleotidyltransferase [Desulfovirgula thermocuniculi]